MTKRIIIAYFPKGLKYCAPLLAAAGVYLIVVSHPVWGGLFVVLSALILTTNYVTEIDLGKKRYRDYLSVLGLAFNDERNTFGRIDRIVITKGNYSQTLNTRYQTRQMDWTDYTATIIFDNNHLDLLTRTSKKELLLGVKPFAMFLNTNVEDRTTGQPYWIDMQRV